MFFSRLFSIYEMFKSQSSLSSKNYLLNLLSEPRSASILFSMVYCSRILDIYRWKLLIFLFSFATLADLQSISLSVTSSCSWMVCTKILNVNLDPLPTLVSTKISPMNCWTNALQMASPSPIPVWLIFLTDLTCPNNLKIFCMPSSLMPYPVSLTEISRRFQLPSLS